MRVRVETWGILLYVPRVSNCGRVYLDITEPVCTPQTPVEAGSGISRRITHCKFCASVCWTPTGKSSESAGCPTEFLISWQDRILVSRLVILLEMLLVLLVAQLQSLLKIPLRYLAKPDWTYSFISELLRDHYGAMRLATLQKRAYLTCYSTLPNLTCNAHGCCGVPGFSDWRAW